MFACCADSSTYSQQKNVMQHSKDCVHVSQSGCQQRGAAGTYNPSRTLLNQSCDTPTSHTVGTCSRMTSKLRYRGRLLEHHWTPYYCRGNTELSTVSDPQVLVLCIVHAEKLRSELRSTWVHSTYHAAVQLPIGVSTRVTYQPRLR
jgi:hypothetical protein